MLFTGAGFSAEAPMQYAARPTAATTPTVLQRRSQSCSQTLTNAKTRNRESRREAQNEL